MFHLKRHNLSLQQLNEQDISQLLLLSESVGWDYDESEIKTIMSVGSVYGHRTDTGDITSCAAIIPYENALASLGMVIVHPSYRRLGLGQEVTMKCIQSLPHAHCYT
jgi:ribosomal protein S18 acetylase RimI-like enzyme